MNTNHSLTESFKEDPFNTMGDFLMPWIQLVSSTIKTDAPCVSTLLKKELNIPTSPGQSKVLVWTCKILTCPWVNSKLFQWFWNKGFTFSLAHWTNKMILLDLGKYKLYLPLGKWNLLRILYSNVRQVKYWSGQVNIYVPLPMVLSGQYWCLFNQSISSVHVLTEWMHGKVGVGWVADSVSIFLAVPEQQLRVGRDRLDGIEVDI